MVNYPKQPAWLYKNQKYNNTFVFTNDHSKITLYYEPIIYDEDRTNVNGIAIYRNNTVSINRETDDERQGRYYVPDYVLKYEADGKENYIICDAKFSKYEKVKYHLMPDLIYKYVVSFSPINELACIKGLYTFYGINELNKEVTTFFDRHILSTKLVSPAIEMVPISENISYSDQSIIWRECVILLTGI